MWHSISPELPVSPTLVSNKKHFIGLAPCPSVVVGSLTIQMLTYSTQPVKQQSFCCRVLADRSGLVPLCCAVLAKQAGVLI